MSVDVVLSTAAPVTLTGGDSTFGQMKRDIAEIFGYDGDPKKVALAGRLMWDVVDDLNRKALYDFNIVSTTISTTGGVATYAIPADWWKMYNARRTNDADFQLTTLRRKMFDTIFIAQRTIVGIPYILVIKNTFRQGLVTVFPTPDTVHTLDVNYYKLISKPIVDADFFDLPKPFQVVPKYGAAARMAAIAGDRNSEQLYQGLFQAGVGEMLHQDEDVGDEELRMINIEELVSRISYLSPSIRPRAYDLW